MNRKSDTLSGMPVLSEDELDELDELLMSDVMSDESMLIDSLDGYLTAIAIGPATPMPSEWIPGIWGPTPEDAPAFESKEQSQRMFDLLVRHFNGILWSLESDPQGIAPVFSMRKSEYDAREYLDADMWVHGFMQGVELSRPEWQPLFDDAQGQVWLTPFHLLFGIELSEEEEALVRWPAQREELAKQIPELIAEIHRYWLPYRKAVHEHHLATTLKRASPKTGRNDPCPCGSGKKFKKCCGAESNLH